MLDKMPNDSDIIALIGENLYDVWQKLILRISAEYDMDCIWNGGGESKKTSYKICKKRELSYKR